MTRNDTLPSLGESASEGLSAAQERKLGDDIMREIRQDPDYLDDPVLQNYLEGAWQRLLAAARARGHVGPDQAAHDAWEVFLVRDRAVNAFALPGGFVGVHLGLIAMTSQLDELAAVMAHELSHVTQRHIARRFGVQGRQTMVGVASMILGIIAASRNPTAASALITGGQAAAIQGQLNFSRDMEREADRVGFGVLSDAGFSIGGMASMFEKMDQSSRFNDDQSFPYLRTHPLTSERIAEAKARAGEGTRGSMGAVLEHAVMQGRARVLMDGRAQALARLAADQGPMQATTAQRLAVAASAALAAARLREPVRADAALAQARTLARGDAAALRALQRLEVELLLERGEARRAAQVWRQGSLRDGSRVDLWLAARVALLGDGAQAWQAAAEDLQSWVAAHPKDALMWSLLASLAQRLDQPLRAARAEAESRYARGDVIAAVERLKGAQRQARSLSGDAARMAAMDAAVIDSRLKELDQERLALEREARQQGGR